MGFWNRIFGGTPSPPPPPPPPPPPAAESAPAQSQAAGDDTYAARRQKAIDHLRGGDARNAFTEFRWTLEYPGHLDEKQWPEALDLFARICEPIAGAEMANVVRAAAKQPNDVDKLYDLGFRLVENALHGIAATVLARAHRLAPQEEGILSELIVALEGAGRNHDAVRILRAAPALLAKSPINRYLLAFDTLMTCDIDGARRELATVEHDAAADQKLASIVTPLRDMLRRADALREVTPLDEKDLRGWHAVVNGALLLHISPYGFDEGMRGRYAFVIDSQTRCLEGIKRLAAVMEVWSLPASRVLLMEGRDSEALGLAAAKSLGVPTERWRPDATSPGLIVAYDLSALEEPALRALHPHRAGQMLWAHATQWTAEFPFAADVATYLYQHNMTPWQEGRIKVDPVTRERLPSPAVEGTAEQLADLVVAESLEPEALNDLDTLVRIARAMPRIDASDPAAFAPIRIHGHRLRLRSDSPVKSSRFM
jgi:hypothetical protein